MALALVAVSSQGSVLIIHSAFLFALYWFFIINFWAETTISSFEIRSFALCRREKIEDIYRERNEWLPNDLRNELGHFNVFRLDRDIGKSAKPSPNRKRDWNNITLVYGPGKYLYADRIIEVQKHALVFDKLPSSFNASFTTSHKKTFPL